MQPHRKSKGTWRVKQNSTLDFIPFKMISHKMKKMIRLFLKKNEYSLAKTRAVL